MSYAVHHDADDDVADAAGVELVHQQSAPGDMNAAGDGHVSPSNLPTHDGDFGRGRASTDDSDEHRRRYPHSGAHPAAVEPVSRVCGMEWTVFASVVCVAFTLVVVIVGVVLWADEGTMATSGTNSATNLLPTTVEEVEHCIMDHTIDTLDQEGRGNKRLSNAGPEYVLLKNATIWTGSLVPGREELLATDILIKSTRIHDIGQDLTAPPGAEVINVAGRIVTPGIVDMHSHAGVYGWPEVWAREDGNEMTNPTMPQVRAIDAYDPIDAAIPLILSGGVTTSQILPGSGNAMGGEGFIVKMRGRTVRDAYYPGSPRLLKHALGENPKRVYGNKGVTPMSRMGSAWVMRQKYEAARNLVHLQQDWCRDPQHRHEDVGDHTHTQEYFDLNSHHTPFPRDLSLNGLVALLRGQARLHVHGYEIQDIEMMLRLSREFDFNVSAFHHALETYMIPDIILESGATIATFSDLWGYKMEAYDASVRSPSVLTDAGVSVALKSDHPVLFSKDLMYEAAKAHYYGLNKWKAIAAVTSVPADAMGMGTAVGQIYRGFDADVVVWDRDPLVLGAKPDMVFVNGEKLIDNGIPHVNHPTSRVVNRPTLTPAAGQCSPSGAATYAVQGVTVFHQNPALPAEMTDATIVVENGTVKCMGTSPACPIPPSAVVYEVSGGFVTPGFVETLSHIGQTEIDSESSTKDGHVSGPGASGDSAGIMAIDGIRMSTRHVASAWKAGVTTSVSQPAGNQLLAGLSVAFHTHGLTVSDALIHPHSALHANVGQHAKQGGVSNSISGQFHVLREHFRAVTYNESYPAPPQNIIRMVKTNRFIPLVVHANQADTIDAAIRFKRHADCDMIIAGAAEAHLLADRLVANNISVILKARQPPHDFQTLRSVDDAIVQLTRAGVKTALAMGDEDNARNLRWEAGLAQDQGLTFEEALASVTTQPASMFGLPDYVGRIVVGQKANFVVFNGAPLSLQGQQVLVALGSYVECQPQQR